MVLFVFLLGASGSRPDENGRIAKQQLHVHTAAGNLLKPNAWQPYQQGFRRGGDAIVCDNGSNTRGTHGAVQQVILNQKSAQPIIATASSRAENVSGHSDSGYAVYLDLVFTDGSHLWGQHAAFESGTHSWQRREVVILPKKPVRRLAMYLLLRGHSGKVWFRRPYLQTVSSRKRAFRFDGVPVLARTAPTEGFQIRDVAAEGDFITITGSAIGLKLDRRRSEHHGTVFWDVTLTNTTGEDRAVTLVYTVPVDPSGLTWWDDPRRSRVIERPAEYVNTVRAGVGANGQLSRYPLAAVGTSGRGVGLGIDMARPACFRLGYNAGAGELFLAYDIGLTTEHPTADVRFCQFSFDGRYGFRGALAEYYRRFPRAFRRRVSRQGLWMPFAKISAVKDWQDFGFRFKEGTDEPGWDDRHGILTFRYTEPMTWWLRMPVAMPRTFDAAVSYARRLAIDKHDIHAQALLNSGFYDEQGRLVAHLRKRPWADGAVWSMNSMPGIPGTATDFRQKWNPKIFKRFYGPQRTANVDGEYIDSSEGYETAPLDFRREHLAAARTPLCFSLKRRTPAIYRGLVTFEYIRRIADDMHAAGKLMMANGTPNQLCWLAPQLDVLGTETNWHRGGRWQPMTDADLLYRRALCKAKPFCFLMNTQFERFSHALVEKYMKRSLAYGMFPGFFSHNASQGQYFTRPKLYERDRPLFRKYIPLCRRVAEAGWQPITQAVSSDADVYVERFGDRYLTLFNDSPQRRTVTVRRENHAPPARSRDLVTGQTVIWRSGSTTLTLDGEDVAVIDLNASE